MTSVVPRTHLLNPYSANFSIKSKISFAVFPSTPFATQPSTNPLRSWAMTSAFFFPIARRSRSARPSE